MSKADNGDSKYKGSKIEWDVDECELPLEKIETSHPPKENVPPKKALNPMANRFQLLNLEDDDDDNALR
jgi:hypothetical protein